MELKRTLGLALLTTVTLTGCGGMFLKQAQSDCSAFGFTAGSSEYADCVQSQYGHRVANFQQGMANASPSVNQSQQPQPSATARGMRIFKSSYTSGMNRICVYDRMGSQEVQTIGAAEICPIN